MKKVAIAAAVAGAFSAQAMAAEMSTSIYYDVSYFSTDAATANSNTITSDGLQGAGSNNLNFAFSDDLGNGMTLNANMQFSLAAVETAGGGIDNRDSTIGLSGDFGSIAMGTIEFDNEVQAIIIDNFDANHGTGALGGPIQGGTLGLTGYTTARAHSDAIQWTSPNINGITVKALYTAGQDTVTAAADYSGVEYGVDYASGPFHAWVGVMDLTDVGTNDSQTTPVAGNYFKGNFVVLAYDAGMATVKVALQSLEGREGSTVAEQDATSISILVPTADGFFTAGTTSIGDQNLAGATLANSGYSQWEVGYMHNMSANTKAYVRYASDDVDANYTASGGTASSNDTLAIGLRFTY